MTVKLDYKGTTLLVSNKGVIYDVDGNVLPQRTIKNKQTGYENPYPYVYLKLDGRARNIQVSRLVCMAFHPLEQDDYSQYQADHIDNNPKNNIASNLRWVSRQFNNSRKHTRMMKSKNYKKTSHKDEFLRAENIETGEVRFFKNGIHAAKELGCSHVLIYNAITGTVTTNAKGWKLKWVPRDCEEAQEFRREFELEIMQNELMRTKQKIDAREARRQLREEAKRMEKEIKRLHRQALERERQQIADATQSALLDIRENAKREIEELKHQHEIERKQYVWERHAILQYTLDGAFVREWRGVTEAQKATGITNISKCLKGAIQNAGGFVWKWKVER